MLRWSRIHLSKIHGPIHFPGSMMGKPPDRSMMGKPIFQTGQWWVNPFSPKIERPTNPAKHTRSHGLAASCQVLRNASESLDRSYLNDSRCAISFAKTRKDGGIRSQNHGLSWIIMKNRWIIMKNRWIIMDYHGLSWIIMVEFQTSDVLTLKIVVLLLKLWICRGQAGWQVNKWPPESRHSCGRSTKCENWLAPPKC